MIEIYGYIIAILCVLLGGVFTFMQGRSSGADRKEREIEDIAFKERESTEEVRQEVRKTISKSKEATNAQTRDDLIDSLTGDSLRKPEG